MLFIFEIYNVNFFVKIILCVLEISDNFMIYFSSIESLYSRIESYVFDFSVRVDFNFFFVRIRRV